MNRYQIRKRGEEESDAKFWPVNSWPWIVRYPDGGSCLCFSFESAVAVMDGKLKSLKYARDHFEHQRHRYEPQ